MKKYFTQHHYMSRREAIKLLGVTTGMVLLPCGLWVKPARASVIHYAEVKASSALNNTDEGSTAYDNSTSIGSPVSIATALRWAVAGDLVLFRGGTYNLGNYESYQGLHDFQSSGTSDADDDRIIFRAYTGETPIITGTTSRGDGIFTWIGIRSGSYITIDGFQHGTSVSQTVSPRIMIGNYSAPDAEYITIQNCTFYGGPSTYNDNRESMRISGQHCLIKNNFFTGMRHTDHPNDGDNNYCGIKLYWGENNIIENNNFTYSQSAVNDKSANHATGPLNNIFRYNYVDDTQEGWYSEDSSSPNDDGYKIYHNIFNNILYIGIHLTVGEITTDMKIYNNTLVGDCTNSALLWLKSFTGIEIYNNIIFKTEANGESCRFGQAAADNTITAMDHNEFGNVRSCRIGKDYGGGGTTYSPLSSWQSSGELIGGGNPGTGSGESMALTDFDNSNLTEISHFHYADGVGQGTTKGNTDDDGNIGADVTKVGINGASGGSGSGPQSGLSTTAPKSPLSNTAPLSTIN